MCHKLVKQTLQEELCEFMLISFEWLSTSSLVLSKYLFHKTGDREY